MYQKPVRIRPAGADKNFRYEYRLPAVFVLYRRSRLRVVTSMSIVFIIFIVYGRCRVPDISVHTRIKNINGLIA